MRSFVLFFRLELQFGQLDRTYYSKFFSEPVWGARQYLHEYPNGTYVNSVVSTSGSPSVLSAAAGQSGTYEATFTARAGDDILLFNNFLWRGDYWLDNIENKPI